MTRREWKKRNRRPDWDIVILVVVCISALIAWCIFVGLSLAELWPWGTYN